MILVTAVGIAWHAVEFCSNYIQSPLVLAPDVVDHANLVTSIAILAIIMKLSWIILHWH
ncbi:hypothetical protein IHE45_14G082700 [Dioscorea alata]|uniref:Uncharacterized protein n=2 Tax=Dioscorea alata TaxID=55571 RepID=A0ACB7UT62_DIOAL|nr:hypothetical protein IHE45_14G082700 [Dioscorea alata]KAH7663842.1 hypothetical protein IHE45_14G082700 [Dioscorea alata]